MCDVPIKNTHENERKQERRSGGGGQPAVEVEIYSGIEFTRLDSTPLQSLPLLKNTWCKLAGWLWKKKRGGGRKDRVDESEGDTRGGGGGNFRDCREV